MEKENDIRYFNVPMEILKEIEKVPEEKLGNSFQEVGIELCFSIDELIEEYRFYKETPVVGVSDEIGILIYDFYSYQYFITERYNGDGSYTTIIYIFRDRTEEGEKEHFDIPFHLSCNREIEKI